MISLEEENSTCHYDTNIYDCQMEWKQHQKIIQCDILIIEKEWKDLVYQTETWKEKTLVHDIGQ